MLITVKNSAPFQILTSAMVIGPSPTGYQLEVAADGRNFSPLFSVGPNVTRQVTNLSSGAYYRLNGNVGDVVVNWRTSCVSEGGGEGGSGTELEPITEFPVDVPEGTVVAYAGSASATGIYQYVDSEWVAAGGGDMSAYWTSAEKKTYVDSAITGVQDQLDTIDEVIPAAIVDLNEKIAEISGATPSTEDLELPIAAAVNKLKGDFEARLDQQFYKKKEVNDIASRKVEAGQVAEQIKDYVGPAITEVYATIEDKELATSAALNQLNGAINTIDEVIPAAIVDINNRMVSSSSVSTIWRGTQTEYDDITTKDPNTLYIIVNE